MTDYISFNQERWNRVNNAYTEPISHADFQDQKNQPLSVYLTVGKPVPLDWFDKAVGNKLLGLACGGGQQGPLFSAKGYDVTIMDFSASQLEKDRVVAKRENISITTVQADMTQPFPFKDDEFDIIFCPVSNVYIEDLTNLWHECHRVLKKGGLLMVGYMNPWIYHFDSDIVWDQPEVTPSLAYALPFNARELEAAGALPIDPQYGYEFSHTLESQIGGQLRAGFALLDFYESKNDQHRLTHYGSDYLANLAVKL